jgi:4-hydroxy-tetrahydrodipicolinate reductase
MKIALIGYGKMGKIIESVALSRGHEIVLKIDLENIDAFTAENLSAADVAIEFTGPHTAFDNVMKCIDFHTQIDCGSKVRLEKLASLEENCTSKDGSFLYASNFSVGVNIFFEVNKKLAQLMEGQTQYDVSIKEIHHTQKKDAPSGTAISLAEQVIENNSQKNKWQNEPSNTSNELYIESERIDPYPGWHEVKYSSDIDEIKIIHNAHNRNGFALGAVLAAEFIKDKKGIFTMKDVLGFGD